MTIRQAFLEYVRLTFPQYITGNVLECGTQNQEDSLRILFQQKPATKWFYCNDSQKQLTDIVCPYSEIPFINNYFMSIFLNNIWKDTTTTRADIEKAIRLLSPGGFLIIHNAKIPGASADSIHNLETEIKAGLGETMGYYKVYICTDQNNAENSHIFTVAIKKPFYDKYGIKSFA